MIRLSVLALLVFGSASVAVAQSPVLHWKSGSPVLRVAGADAFGPAAEGAALNPGTLLQCGARFEGRLVYPDGTQLKLKEGTILEVLRDGIRLSQGATWIKVHKSGRSFRCVTPSAIASVRGTQFAVEVVGVDRLMTVALARGQGGQPVLDHAPISALVAVEAGMAMAATLTGLVPDGRLPSTVKVFEGRVMVARLDARRGKVVDAVTLSGGEKLLATADRVGRQAPIAATDYRQWSLPVPAGVGAPGASAQGPSDNAAPTASGGHPGASVTLLESVSDAP